MINQFTISLLLAGAAATAQAATPSCWFFSLAGEVRAGEMFTKIIGGGLSFQLEPQSPAPDEDGWSFEIRPTTPVKNPDGSDEFDLYVYALTPPYRFGNAQNLGTSYGINAEKAVAATPREFWFLTDRRDGATAADALNHVLWPQSDTDQEHGLSILGRLSRGQGRLHIFDSRITPGAPDVPGHQKEPTEYGALHWLKFRVDLVVPIGFRPAKELNARTDECPADFGKWAF